MGTGVSTVNPNFTAVLFSSSFDPIMVFASIPGGMGEMSGLPVVVETIEVEVCVFVVEATVACVLPEVTPATPELFFIASNCVGATFTGEDGKSCAADTPENCPSETATVFVVSFKFCVSSVMGAGGVVASATIACVTLSLTAIAIFSAGVNNSGFATESASFCVSCIDVARAGFTSKGNPVLIDSLTATCTSFNS